jgi:hypothetical protein
MRKLLGVLLVVALLAAGGVAYALISSSSATAQDENATTAQDESGTTDTTVADDVESGDTTTDDTATRPGRRDVLGEVLDGLVTDGTITQDQADQIRDAIAAKREELRAELGDLRGERSLGDRHGFRGFGPGFEDFLADGVIDADELAQLPEGNPLTDPDGPAAPYLEDGQITQEELDQLMADLEAEGFRFRHGLGIDTDQDATESSFSF